METAESHDPTNEDDDSYRIARYGDVFSETIKLLVEWRLDAVAYLCSSENLTVLSLVANGKDLSNCMSLHNLCATHDVIARESGVIVE